MRYWTLVAMTAALVFAPSARAATTRYVSPAGSGDCSQPSPCSFNDARVLSAAGDVLALAPGEYDIQGTQVFSEPVTIEGVRGARPVLRLASLQLQGPGSAVHDVSVVGTARTILLAVGATVQRVDATYADVAVDVDNVCEFDGAGSQVLDTACRANPNVGGANAIALNAWSHTATVAPGDFVLRHVTAFSAGAAITSSASPPATATISDSILAGAFSPNGAVIAVDHSATTQGALPGDGNVSTSLDAIFPNVILDGVRPAAGSPTIDAGSGGGDFDLAGIPRVLGSAPDMGAYEWQPTAPVVSTGEVTAVTASGANVPGSVDARGAATTFRVEYGPTSGYGAATGEVAVGARTVASGVQATLGGLAAATTYHYRLVATNSEGATAGEDRTFTTASLPAATPTATPTPTPKPKVTVSLGSNKHCLRTRTQTLRVKIARGGTITAVEVYVNKKRKLRVTKAKDLKKSIKVAKLPKGSYTLEVRVKTKDGRTVKSSKRYRTCSGH
jgi:hypothetical protein